MFAGEVYACYGHPAITAAGQPRKRGVGGLEAPWTHKGKRSNLTCRDCYSTSSPSNDRLAYISTAEVAACPDEIERERLATDTARKEFNHAQVGYVPGRYPVGNFWGRALIIV